MLGLMPPVSGRSITRARALLALLGAVAAAGPSAPLRGDGRFNKAYCMHGTAWGDVAFWQSAIARNLTRVAQLSTVNTTGTFFLSVVAGVAGAAGTAPPAAFALTSAPANVSVDLGCQPRSMPDYSGVAFGSWSPEPSAPVVWAPGPIGDATKRGRCWWVRCNTNETESDMCGSEGEAPCAKLDASFLRYASPSEVVDGAGNGAPSSPSSLDESCYPISLDSQVDPSHRVDWRVRFVDGMWPPSLSSAHSPLPDDDNRPPALAAAAVTAAPSAPLLPQQRPALGDDPGRPSLDVGSLPAYFAGADMLWGWNASGGGALDPLAPQKWYSGAYIGNGFLGAMATAVVDADSNATTAIRIDVGRTDVWECRQRDPVGHLMLAPAATMPPLLRVDMRVDLFRAQLWVNFTFPSGAAAAAAGEGGGSGRAAPAAAFDDHRPAPSPSPAPALVVAVRISINADGEGVAATPGVLLAYVLPSPGARSAGSPSMSLPFASALSPVSFDWVDDNDGACPSTSVATGSVESTPWGSPIDWSTQTTSTGTFSVARTTVVVAVDNDDHREHDGRGGSTGEAAQSIRSSSGGSSSSSSSSSSSGAGGTALILAVANSQRSKTNTTASLGLALSQVAAAVAATPSGLEEASTGWWAGFWSNTSFFSFDSAGGLPGVTKLEQYTHIAGYRYASAARGTMSDLMGPWGPSHATTCIGPWCQYCWDMNQQVMLYLPTPSNRGRLLGAPAFDMAGVFVQGGPSAWVDAFGSNPPSGAANTLWWLAQLHRYCLYHGDDARLLSTLLPGLRAQLAASGLQNGTDGLLHVKDCVSPEYPMPPSDDCSYDLSILRWAAGTAEAVAAALDPADPARPLYRDIAARLAPLPVDPKTGSYMLAAGVPFAVPHRHYSHLLQVYDLEGLGAPEGTAAASLDLWFNITCAGPQAHGPDWEGDGECRGFTQAAMSAMSGRLGRASAALGNLSSLLTLVGLPNAMYGEEVYAGHPSEFSPVSESAYSAAASAYRLLLRSDTPQVPQSGAEGAGGGAAGPTVVHVWPAASPFANATFFRLRAPGALLVSAVREDGKTLWVAIEADVFSDGGGGGAAVANFTLVVADWAGGTLTVVSGAQGVAASPVPGGVPAGAFLVSGLARGGAAAFTLAGGPQPPPARGFVVGVAEGRNATEANAWGGAFVFQGEFA